MNVSRLAARTAAALSSVAVALTGVSVLTAAPAQATVRVSDYGFQTSAFGTKVKGDAAGVSSARTAYSYISCTRLTGLNKTNTGSAHEMLAGIALPSTADPVIRVGAVESTSKTYRTKTRNQGTLSRNSITKVTLGPIVVSGLETEARAWADRNGRLHSSSTARGGVTLTSDTGTPLDDVLGPVSAPLSTLLNNIPADGLEIPELGTIYVSKASKSVTRGTAWATGIALRVRLDAPEGGSVTVTVGRSHAKVYKGLVAGVFSGSGWGADIPTGLGGIAKVGRLGNQPLPCRGTRGDVRVNRSAGFAPGSTGQLEIGALAGRAFGVQERTGVAKAWTEGRVASITVGPLALEGIVGRALAKRTRSGAIRRSASGSTVGSMTVDGKRQAVPDPGRTVCVGQGGACAIKVTFLDKTRLRGGIRVTAVRLEVLAVEGIPLGTVINLGNARAVTKRH